MKRIGQLTILIVAVLAIATACRPTFALQIETTPALEATISALEVENSALATQVATAVPPTPTATPQPDLGHLAYVQGGDIWVNDLPDGEPRRLTMDGHNTEPKWSPSGEWLGFRKDDGDQLWVVRSGGGADHPLNAGVGVSAFAWSPVTDTMAFVGAPDGTLYLESPKADASGPAALVRPAPMDAPASAPEQQSRIQALAWSPDGARIAYTMSRTDGAGGPENYQGIWLVYTASKLPQELYASGAPQNGEVQLQGWTADGASVLFWQGEIFSASMLADGVPLYAISATGGDPVQLADAVLYRADFVQTAPAGDHVAAVVGGGRTAWTNKRIAVTEPGAKGLSYLTAQDEAAILPTWSPDGTQLAYMAMPDGGDWVGGDAARQAMMARSIWIIDVSGSDPIQLTDDASYRDERPLWSSDGSQVLFARLDENNRASLWLVSAAGGEPQQVVAELTPAPEWFGYYGYIAWDQYFDWHR